ncbi:MAG TPA: hypothetical protein VFS32_12400 [Candidatus Limnocylindrales bacterium]|nr:hypothetical protein [Candidatus Limnocylindrales bacterium]
MSRLDRDEPDRLVRAPLSAALDRIVTLGAIGYGLACAVVFVPAICPLPPAAHEAAHLALPALVVAHLAVRTLLRLVDGRPRDEDLARAWDEAREFDRPTTLVAILVVTGGSIGLLLALLVMAEPHLAEPGQLGVYAAVYLPLLGALWILATVSFAHGARDRLATALGESDRRLREYWAAVARH